MSQRKRRMVVKPPSRVKEFICQSVLRGIHDAWPIMGANSRRHSDNRNTSQNTPADTTRELTASAHLFTHSSNVAMKRRHLE